MSGSCSTINRTHQHRAAATLPVVTCGDVVGFAGTCQQCCVEGWRSQALLTCSQACPHPGLPQTPGAAEAQRSNNRPTQGAQHDLVTAKETRGGLTRLRTAHSLLMTPPPHPTASATNHQPSQTHQPSTDESTNLGQSKVNELQALCAGLNHAVLWLDVAACFQGDEAGRSNTGDTSQTQETRCTQACMTPG